MADLSKIKLNGTEYNIKDSVAREGAKIKFFDISAESYLNKTNSTIFSFNCTQQEFLELFNNYVIYIRIIATTDSLSSYNVSIGDILAVLQITTLDTLGSSFVSYNQNQTIKVFQGSIISDSVDSGFELNIVRIIMQENGNFIMLNDNRLIPHVSNSRSTTESSPYDSVSGDLNLSYYAFTEELPLIVTGTCAFGSSLLNGIDSPVAVTNISHTIAQIATAISNNRPVEMILNNNGMKINLKLTAFDGSIYYFTNSYDPFNGVTNADNESFNITVKAQNENDVDSFTYFITYNKNAFATKSEVTTQISTAVGNLTEFDTQVVQTLPATGVKGTIYFTPNNHGANDIYDEFIYVNNAWEKIGNTQVDLTGYARTDQLANVAVTGSYNNLVDTPDIPTKISDLVDDSDFITLNDVPVELPAVTSADNNKVLTVDNGVWSAKTPVASFSGSYNDLSDKPTLFSGNYNDLTNKPTLFSGSYNDLSDKPTIPSATTVTQTVTSGIKIAEINGTAIYAPTYANGDLNAY